MSQADLLRMAAGVKQLPAVGKLLNARIAAIDVAVAANKAQGGQEGLSRPGQGPGSLERVLQQGLVSQGSAGNALSNPMVPIWLWEEEAPMSGSHATVWPESSGPGSRQHVKPVTRPSSKLGLEDPGEVASAGSLGKGSGSRVTTATPLGVEDLGSQLHRLVLVKGSHLGSGAHGVVMAGMLLDPAGGSPLACAVKFMSMGYTGLLDTTDTHDPFEETGDTQTHGTTGNNHGQAALPPAIVAQRKRAFQMCLSEADVLKQVRCCSGPACSFRLQAMGGPVGWRGAWWGGHAGAAECLSGALVSGVSFAQHGCAPPSSPDESGIPIFGVGVHTRSWTTRTSWA